MRSNKRVVGAWDVGFHSLVEQARKDYSKTLGKELSMHEVTRIWGEGRITKFKIPKIRIRRLK
jgi:hypothetical protein